MSDEDWLNIERPAGAQQQNVEKALEIANLYFDAFERNAAGRRLLEMWIDADFNQAVPVNAPHTQYAAVEARRAFIRGIRGQIDLARQGISVG
jgi:hypothetical protein